MDSILDIFQEKKKGRMDLTLEEIEKQWEENESINERKFKAYMARNYGIHTSTTEEYLEEFEILEEIARRRGKIVYLGDGTEKHQDEREKIETEIDRKIGEILSKKNEFTPSELLDKLDEGTKNELGNKRRGRLGNLGKKLNEMGYGRYRGRTSDSAVYTIDDQEKRDKLKLLDRGKAVV